MFLRGAAMTDTDAFNTIYLDLEIRKSKGKVDDFGNYLFEVEASNENLDLQNQIVLQNVLMESKGAFLKGGVISYNHLQSKKSLYARYNTDSVTTTGGQALILEDTNKKTINVAETSQILEANTLDADIQEAAAGLIDMLSRESS